MTDHQHIPESALQMPENGTLSDTEKTNTCHTATSGAIPSSSTAGECTQNIGKRYTLQENNHTPWRVSPKCRETVHSPTLNRPIPTPQPLLTYPHPDSPPESAPKTRENGTLSCGRLGLIGCPIAHSQSPALFREYFADRPDILRHWSYDLIERNTFDEAWATFLQGYTAVNVTAPFKEDAFRAADLHDYSALRCMASNLVVKIAPEAPRIIEQTGNGTTHQAENHIIRPTGSGIVPQIECGIMIQAENGAAYQSESDIAQLNRKGPFSTESIPTSESTNRIMAYNTDFEAVLGILRQEYPEPARHKALIIGCGGAGKAAAAAAIEAGMQTAIYNRTLSRPREFTEHLRTYNPHACSTVPQIIGLDSIEMPIAAEPVTTQSVVGELLAAIRESDTIIYTIPGPATPIQYLLTAHPDILSDKTVIEANYKAPVLAGVHCRRYIPGLTWLRLQAIATYRIVLGPSLIASSKDAKY